jgi:6-phosphogluconate dehydrogenase (decarboxylating)
MLGSVSEHCVSHAQCPLVAVHHEALSTLSGEPHLDDFADKAPSAMRNGFVGHEEKKALPRPTRHRSLCEAVRRRCC